MNKITTYNYPCFAQLQQYYSLVAAHADRWNISENRPADTEFSFTYAFLECWLSVQVTCVLSQTNGNLTSRSICEIWATLSYQFWETPSNFKPLNFDCWSSSCLNVRLDIELLPECTISRQWHSIGMHSEANRKVSWLFKFKVHAIAQ